ncbi:alpha/beta-hydrolase [Pluteus cervinus]|uniref:Alpha/beta-hydrolase n=1 Tax=Pluteus cervinus TaxID=181527 RepID=A0ACD3B603_9AGAR|nr:alpha/beta-hydrolase [Pluteus cervinus]
MYTELAELPYPTSAEFTDQNVIRVSYAVRDHTQNIKRTLVKDIILTNTGPDHSKITAIVTSTHYVPDPKRTILSILSPSRTKRILLLESHDSKRRVEVWNLKNDKLEASLDVTDKHGAFYADEYLASSSFSPDETSFIYTAESKTPETSPSDPYAKFRFTPHFGEGLPGKRRPTLFLIDWPHPEESSATSATETKKPILYTLAPSFAGNIPVLFGQAVFSSSFEKTPNGYNFRIYATGYEYQPDGRLLGIKGCYNRPTGIWELTSSPSSSTPNESHDPPTSEEGSDSKLSTTITLTTRKLTPSNLSCRSPRLFRSPSNTSTKLIWIANPTGGAHASTSSIHTLDLPDDPSVELPIPKAILDIVDTPSQSTSAQGPGSTSKGLGFGFPGFYPTSNNLLDKPFVHVQSETQNELDGYIISSSLWGSRSRILLIPLTAANPNSTNVSPPHDVTPNLNDEPEFDGTLDNWGVLATDGHNRVLCVRSSFVVPYELVLGTVRTSAGLQPQVDWVVLDKPVLSSSVQKALSSLEISIHPIPNRSPTETILLKTKDSTKDTPCVTIPHGGPHGTTTTGFNPSTVALASEGYTISLPNYTGSLGFGESAVRALIGQCGKLDVEDCIASVRYLIEKGISSEGKGKQFVTGGSHGGFLTAHLIGQYPDVFSAAVLRNPVISVGELTSYDIPDWAYAEFGIEYPISSSPSIYQSPPPPPPPIPTTTATTNQTQSPIPHMTTPNYTYLHNASPIFYISKITTPVLLLMGGVDLRVTPATQGIPFYHALKGRGVVTDMLVFEGDSHPLEGVEAGRVGWEAGRDWFKERR